MSSVLTVHTRRFNSSYREADAAVWLLQTPAFMCTHPYIGTHIEIIGMKKQGTASLCINDVSLLIPISVYSSVRCL